MSYDHVPRTWITSVGSFLAETNSEVEVRGKRVVTPQRRNDRFIMQLAVDGKFSLKKIQQCRMFLTAATLADITNAEGQRVEKWALSGVGRK